MTGRRFLIVGVLLLLARPVAANPYSFESGDLSGWLSIGDVFVTTGEDLPEDFPSNDIGASPGSADDYFALLSSGDPFGGEEKTVSAAALEGFFGMTDGYLSSQGYTRGSGLMRSLDLNVGDSLSFQWNFVSGDFEAFANDAALFVLDGAGTVLSSVSLVDFAESTGWQAGPPPGGVFSPLTAGSYSIGVGIFQNDDFGTSHLAVDEFKVTQSAMEDPVSVPEPSTLLLLTAGWGVAVVTRRFKIAPKA